MKKTNSLNNEDIKILKEFIKIDRNMRNNSIESDYDKFCEKRCIAIENLLNKLEENENQDYTLIYMKGYADAEEKYKEKVKDLIINETINISGFECIAVEDLEELLEENK